MASSEWKNKIVYALLSVALALLVSDPQAVFAEGGTTGSRFNLSAAYRRGYPSGREESGWKWSDLYDNGAGGSLELDYRAMPHLTVDAGIAYDTFKGREISVATSTGAAVGRFSNQHPLSLYVGLKGYFLTAEAPESSYGISPYATVDLGLTFFNSVNFNGAEVGKSTTTLAAAIGAGADFLTATHFVPFLEVKYQDYGKPDRAGGAFRAVLLSLGLRYLL